LSEQCVLSQQLAAGAEAVPDEPGHEGCWPKGLSKCMSSGPGGRFQPMENGRAQSRKHRTGFG
jgi:hypothetical protein